VNGVLFLGEYQLRNLIKNQVLFVYIDLRSAETRLREGNDPALHAGAHPAGLETAGQVAKTNCLSKEHPIVLLCENGEKSMQVAADLEKQGYTNVFVVRGGSASFGK